jgi:hypothetical protein
VAFVYSSLNFICVWLWEVFGGDRGAYVGDVFSHRVIWLPKKLKQTVKKLF